MHDLVEELRPLCLKVLQEHLMAFVDIVIMLGSKSFRLLGIVDIPLDQGRMDLQIQVSKLVRVISVNGNVRLTVVATRLTIAIGSSNS